MSKMNLPDELGNELDEKIRAANPELSVGWLLIAVSHGKPIQTMSNMEEGSQVAAAEIAAVAIAKDSMITSSLLSPEGSA